MEELALKLEAIGHPIEEQALCTMILMGITHRAYANTLEAITLGSTGLLKLEKVKADLLLTEMKLKRSGRIKRNDEFGFRAYPDQGRRGPPNRTKAEARKCYNCDKTGHLARDCRKPRRPRASESANTAATKSDERIEYAFATRTRQTHVNRCPTKEKSTHDYMVCDSGATAHMVGDLGYMYNQEKVAPVRIKMANGTWSKATISGSVDLRADNGSHCSYAKYCTFQGWKADYSR